MGGASLEHTVRAVAATLVADAPLDTTVQRIADLARHVAPAALAAQVTLVDGRGRTTDAVRSGGPSSELAEAAGDTLSVPLSVQGATVGRLTLYAAEPASFSDSDEVGARAFASQAAVVVANARAYWEIHELAVGLREAMQSRAVIEQAKGKLMATEGCSADEAFTILARTSQLENVKLRDLARRIVDGSPA